MKIFLKDALGWGVALWAFGYILGIVLFFVVPANIVGWVIMPFGILATLWVLWYMINADNLQHYFVLSVAWTIIAVVLDYFLLVRVFKPVDGYYKIDVYLYYALTFVLPLLVGWFKTQKPEK
jgi:hypothetical protein